MPTIQQAAEDGVSESINFAKDWEIIHINVLTMQVVFFFYLQIFTKIYHIIIIIKINLVGVNYFI